MHFFEQVFGFSRFRIIFCCLPWLQKNNFQQGMKFPTKVSTVKNTKTRKLKNTFIVCNRPLLYFYASKSIFEFGTEREMTLHGSKRVYEIDPQEVYQSKKGWETLL